MAPNSGAPGAGYSRCTTSAHGRNGFGSRHILAAAANCQKAAKLTADQCQAFSRLAPIFRGEGPGARAALTGYAGTGKTFLSARLIALALSIPGALGVRDANGKWAQLPTVVIATPTHKAARQLERALHAYGLGVKATTLHSALGLRPVREEDVETFQPDPKATRMIGGHTVLVVLDETSMVSAQLASLLEQALPPCAALVAIGDPAQLQPVGDPMACPFFTAPIHAHLSEVVRHAGPVLALATATRELGSGRPLFTSRSGDRSGVVAYPGFATWRQAALHECRKASRTGNTDAARVLCWTNAAADKFNRELHQAIYGPTAPSFLAGQPVVSNGAILGPDGAPIVSSTCEMRLETVAPMRGRVEGDELPDVREKLLGKRRTKAGEQLPPWQWWAIEAQIAGSHGPLVRFGVLSPDSATEWRRANNVIAALAKAERAAGNIDGASELWRLFWLRKDRFAAISPVWAMTIHKAQGSTFEQVFLHPDVDRNQDRTELNQLAYVGITRASQALHVIADRQTHANSVSGRGGA